MKNKKYDVILVSLPFSPLYVPSLALSLFKASLTQREISSKICYFSLPFAQLIGEPLYDRISDGEPARSDLLGEWIFTEALYGPNHSASTEYIEQILKGGNKAHDNKKRSTLLKSQAQLDTILAAKSKAPDFIDQCVEQTLALQPKIIGISSTFETQIATLAFSKRIKKLSPQTTVIIGGSNCEGVMGKQLSRSFPFIDYVVSGEADIVFPDLVEQLLQGKVPATTDGVFMGLNDPVIYTDKQPSLTTQPIEDLDSLPYPDFEDFLNTVEQYQHLNTQNTAIHLATETARGCWWGQRKHCTFCGLNGSTMAFRSKSADRAFDELHHISEQYPQHKIAIADNILDHKYFKSLLPKLSKKPLANELFYEVKANLKSQEIKLLKEAGIGKIQPGIESFSDIILEQMGKGVTGLQNIQTLKFSGQYQVEVVWGILWGFPDEPMEEYRWMCEIIPRLNHLPSPSATTKIRLDRFSPNYTSSNQKGFKDVEPFPSYSYIYPHLSPSEIDNLAYFFNYDYLRPPSANPYIEQLERLCQQWQEQQHSPSLFYIAHNDRSIVFDLRQPGLKTHALDPKETQVLLLCSQLQLDKQLSKLTGFEQRELESVLTSLDDKALIVRRFNKSLSIVFDLAEFKPDNRVLQRIYREIDSNGDKQGDNIIINI